jgi:alpha-glucosidase
MEKRESRTSKLRGSSLGTKRSPRASLIFRRRLALGERLFGLGDKAYPLDRRGHVYELWNSDPSNFSPGSDPLYKAIPLLFGVRSDSAWCLYVESTARLLFDCRDDEVRVFGSGRPRVHCLVRRRFVDVFARASELVGRMPLPPLWALGYHQSRWSYRDAEEVGAVVREFRRRRIPLDVLHFDIDHMDGYRVFTWDDERFPDPAQLIRELGVRVVAIVDPGVKVEPGYSVYDELIERGFACIGPDGEPWVGNVWPGACAFPDFSSAAARHWWGDLHRGLVEAGVDGIWIDMNEPSVGRRNTIPEDVRHAACTHAELHNAYGHLMAQATFEGLERLRPGLRPFVLTRAACAGTQRYAATWTGDNRSTWTHLRLALRMCLGLSMSCFPFCGSDIGGFHGRCEPELYARWIQLGAFTPFFRTHYAGALTPGRQEPWSFGPEIEAVARAAIELRHRLLPYTYTAFWRHTTTGLPVMRALALDWQDDPDALACEDEFMWGDSLLVAPVLRKGARRRRVYLPAGDWFDFWTGSALRGPRRVVAAAPLDRIPLFVRAGTVLPLAGGELRVYPGEGTSWLFEDGGETLGGPSCVTAFAVRGDVVRARRSGKFPSSFPLSPCGANASAGTGTRSGEPETLR